MDLLGTLGLLAAKPGEGALKPQQPWGTHGLWFCKQTSHTGLPTAWLLLNHWNKKLIIIIGLDVGFQANSPDTFSSLLNAHSGSRRPS